MWEFVVELGVRSVTTVPMPMATRGSVVAVLTVLMRWGRLRGYRVASWFHDGVGAGTMECIMGWLLAGVRSVKRLMVAGLCVALVVSGLSLAPAAADPGVVPEVWAPKPQVWKKLPHAPTADSGEDVVSGPAAMEQPGPAQPVEPMLVQVSGGPGAEFVQAGDTPISVKAEESVAVRVLGGEETPSAPFAVVFEVEPERVAAVDVEVDAAQLHEAGLVGDADRVALVELPACYADTPERPECGVPVATLQAQPDQDGMLSAVVEASSVMAVASTPSGQSGSFAAQPLGPSSTWSAGSSTGEFSWSYPIAVGPGEVLR